MGRWRRPSLGPSFPAVRPILHSIALSCVAVGAFAGAAGATQPEVGSKAPDFTLQSSDGQTVSLGQFLGKRDLVLAWFPKAFTPG